MSGIKELSVDQMAVLGLVLRQGRPFSDLAGMLGMEEGEMRRRAHEALDALGPADGAGVPGERRAEVSDYLLGQQSAEEQARTRSFLEQSAAGRAWARTVAGQLSELKDPLPEIPDGPADESAADESAAAEPGAVPAAPVVAGAAAATAPVAPLPSEAAAAAAPTEAEAEAKSPPAFGATPAGGPRSSRPGGALLLGGIAVGATAATLFFVLRGGGDDERGPRTPAASTTATQPQAQVEAQVNLVPPSSRKNLKALGVVIVQKAQGQDQLVAAVQGLPKPKSGGFRIWRDSRPGKARRVRVFRLHGPRGAGPAPGGRNQPHPGP